MKYKDGDLLMIHHLARTYPTSLVRLFLYLTHLKTVIRTFEKRNLISKRLYWEDVNYNESQGYKETTNHIINPEV